MKTFLQNTLITLTLILGMTTGQPVSAQSHTFSYYMERTIISPKMGFSVGHRIKEGCEFGVFLQKNMEDLSGERGIPVAKENIFYGGYIDIPMSVRKHFEIRANLRAGAVNKRYFAISPVVHFELKPIDTLRVGIGIGVRNFIPTVMPKISIVL